MLHPPRQWSSGVARRYCFRMFDLLRALTYVPKAHEREGAVVVPDEFCSPGYWSAMACYARRNRIAAEAIQYLGSQMRGYAEAIGLPVALGGEDEYQYQRGTARRRKSAEVST